MLKINKSNSTNTSNWKMIGRIGRKNINGRVLTESRLNHKLINKIESLHWKETNLLQITCRIMVVKIINLTMRECLHQIQLKIIIAHQNNQEMEDYLLRQTCLEIPINRVKYLELDEASLLHPQIYLKMVGIEVKFQD